MQCYTILYYTTLYFTTLYYTRLYVIVSFFNIEIICTRTRTYELTSIDNHLATLECLMSQVSTGAWGAATQEPLGEAGAGDGR